jgi:hypothetical protein
MKKESISEASANAIFVMGEVDVKGILLQFLGINQMALTSTNYRDHLFI